MDLAQSITNLIEQAKAEHKSSFSKEWSNRTISELKRAQAAAYMINRDAPPMHGASDAPTPPANADVCHCTADGVNRNCPIHGIDSIPF